MTDDTAPAPPPGPSLDPSPDAARPRWWTRLLDPANVAIDKVQVGVHGPVHFVQAQVRNVGDQAKNVQEQVVPAWRRVTSIESFLPAALAILAALALQVTLRERVANHPRWVLPGITAILLIVVVIADRVRSGRHSPALRAAILLLVALLSAANAASAVRLVVDLVNGQGIRDPAQLLLAGGAIWLTNVVVFALWYWEFDRGGRAGRAAGVRYPSFLFPQMSDPTFAPADWEPNFFDYLYTSFTNATAFSPTDVMPLSRWAKAAMSVQSMISLVIAVLVIARAVNILR